MTSAEEKAGETESTQQQQLAKRDWIILPSLAVLTVLFLAGSVELTARHIYPALDTLAEDCMVFNDPTTGARGIPNSVCREKIPEGEVTEYHFNSCGYDTGMECGPKPPGQYRIVMIGTSFALGMRVPREKTFAALLPVELTELTQRRVALYNESVPYRYPDTQALHFNEILNAHPDMLLWAMNPGDVTREAQIAQPNREMNLSFPVRLWHRIKTTLATESLSDAVQYFFRHTRTAVLMLNLLYSNQNQFVESSLMAPDGMIGYLRSTPSEEWKKRLAEFDESFGSVEAQAKKAGVPVVVVLLPSHVQADMISMGDIPSGYDPYELSNQLRSIVSKDGGTYVDILPDLRKEPSIQRGYFALDGHPNALGHKVLAKVMAEDLSSGVVPALTAAQKPKAPGTAGGK
jgi:hypothetical protein